MQDIQGKIAELLFNEWVESDPNNGKICAVHNNTIDLFMKRFNLPDTERDFLDASVMDVACKFEKNAFYGGFAQGVALASGNLFGVHNK